MKHIKVLVVDDQQLVREGLRRILELDSEITVVGEARSGEECLSIVRTLEPDVILMDIKMQGMSGIDTTRALRDRKCLAKVIILTVYEDKYVAQAAEAGAVGYLLKDVSRDDLHGAVKMAYAGRAPLSPSVTRSLLTQFGNMVRMSRDSILTSRQLEILRLIAAGTTNKEIAYKVCVSEATVKRETNTICAKLGAVDRTQAVSEGYKRNLL